MTANAPRRHANLRDVARAAGVSVATVSRVVNGKGPVSAATRAGVERAIATLGYAPSAAARAVSTGRTRMVGALVPTLDHAIFARFLQALEARLGAHGLSLVVSCTGGDPAAEADRAAALMDIGVEGLVVSGLARDPGLAQRLARRGLPVIATSVHEAGAAVPTIGYDNAGLAQMALRHLLGLGHRRIAVLHGPARQNDRTRARLQGLRREPAARLALHESALEHGAAGAALEAALAARPDTTAVLCLSDVLAQGALFAAQRAGLAVPGRLSILGFDDLPGSAETCPPLTTVALPVAAMGTAAADALAGWVERGERPAPRRLDAALVVRGSTGAPPQVPGI